MPRAFLYSNTRISAKWLELLKEIAPRVIRVAVLRDTEASGIGQLRAIQTVAPSSGLKLSTDQPGRRPSDRARHCRIRARTATAGLIVTASGFAVTHREMIATLAAQHNLPAVYPFRYFVEDGGLISYGPDVIDPFRRAAGYVDRILRGEKPADLPVQAPTKYELVINLKTAKALGLDIPPSLLARADEVIE